MFKITSKALLATAVSAALVLGGVSVSAFAADDMQCVDLGGRRIIKKLSWVI